MAKDKRELSPAEVVLAKWAEEASGGQGMLPDFDGEFSASFPALWTFLTWTQIGKMKKEPGSVSMRAEGTGWKLTYYDPSALRSCSVASTTLMEGLRKLDAALVHPDTLWVRTDRRKKGWTEKKA